MPTAKTPADISTSLKRLRNAEGEFAFAYSSNGAPLLLSCRKPLKASEVKELRKSVGPNLTVGTCTVNGSELCLSPTGSCANPRVVASKLKQYLSGNGIRYRVTVAG